MAPCRRRRPALELCLFAREWGGKLDEVCLPVAGGAADARAPVAHWRGLSLARVRVREVGALVGQAAGSGLAAAVQNNGLALLTKYQLVDTITAWHAKEPNRLPNS